VSSPSSIHQPLHPAANHHHLGVRRSPVPELKLQLHRTRDHAILSLQRQYKLTRLVSPRSTPCLQYYLLSRPSPPLLAPSQSLHLTISLPPLSSPPPSPSPTHTHPPSRQCSRPLLLPSTQSLSCTPNLPSSWIHLIHPTAASGQPSNSIGINNIRLASHSTSTRQHGVRHRRDQSPGRR